MSEHCQAEFGGLGLQLEPGTSWTHSHTPSLLTGGVITLITLHS